VATRQPGPKYPDKAIRNEAEGFVRVRVLIGENGAVKSHEILEAEPAGVFEESLESVVPLWQFTPALDEAGRPMEFWKEYKYVFKLEVGS
jgi:protein TonB